MSSFPGKHLTLFLLLFFGLAVSRSIAADWPAITPQEKAMASIPQQPDAPAVILYREETTDDTKNFRTVYFRIKVLTEAGIKYGDVEIPVGHHPFTISQVSGRTVHADGRIIPLEDQPVDKVVVRDHGVRFHVKAFTLSSVQVGSILDCRYSLHFPEGSRNAPAWIVQSGLLEKRVVFKFVPTKYQPKMDNLRAPPSGGPNDFEIIGNTIGGEPTGEYSWVKYLPAGNQPEEHVTPQALYKWVDLEMNDVPAFPDEPFMPPAGSVGWRVSFFYRNQARAEDYWKRAGKSWDKEVESFLHRKQGILEAVNRLAAAGDTPEIKARKIYAAVSQLENQSFAPASHQASPPTPAVGVEDVLQRRSGPHDELNRLFVAMIRAAGIPVTMMWVADRGHITFDSSFMSTDQLDAEIAIVRLGGEDVFLDPGTKFCPYGVLNWHYAGVRGLRQRENGAAELAESPASTYQQAIIQRVARLQLTEKGSMEGTLAVGFSGLEAMVRRQQAAGMNTEGRGKLVEDEVRGWLPAGTSVALTNSPEWDKTEATLVAKFKVAGPWATNHGRRWVVPIHVFEADAKPRFPAAQRANYIYFDYASRQLDDVHIILPANAELEKLPPNQHSKTSYATYDTEQKREGSNGLVCTRDLALNSVLFPPAEYGELKDFYDKVATGDAQPATLKDSLHVQNN